jgi:serine/threonine protein kinase
VLFADNIGKNTGASGMAERSNKRPRSIFEGCSTAAVFGVQSNQVGSSPATTQLDHQQQQQQDKMETDCQPNQLRTCSLAPKQHHNSTAARGTCMLLPGQAVTFEMMDSQLDDGDMESGKKQQLVVVGLLSSDETSQSYDVQLLSDNCNTTQSSSAAGATLAAATEGSGGSGSGSGGNDNGTEHAHSVLKVPLSWDCVSSKAQLMTHRAVYSSELEYNSKCWQKMETEHQLLMKLAGEPGIIRCHGYGIAELPTAAGDRIPARCLLLEHCKLGSLAQRLMNEAGEFEGLNAAQAWKVVKTMAGALDKVHTAGYVYGDLKPENICVSQVACSLVYKFIEFSSCVQVQSSGLTAPGSVGGLKGFMAPEVGKKVAHSVNADTWSLGELPEPPSSSWVHLSTAGPGCLHTLYVPARHSNILLGCRALIEASQGRLRAHVPAVKHAKLPAAVCCLHCRCLAAGAAHWPANGLRHQCTRQQGAGICAMRAAARLHAAPDSCAAVG